MLIKMAQTRDVHFPNRGHATDAGIDFYCPVINEQFMEDFGNIEANSTITNYGTDGINVAPGCNAVIPAGIKMEIPFGHMGLFLNKSGVATKLKLMVGAQVIDTFYSGEVHIDLHNVGTDWVTITPGMKLAQMVIVPAIACEPTDTDEENLYIDMKQGSFRDEGGFGSTDKKKA